MSIGDKDVDLWDHLTETGKHGIHGCLFVDKLLKVQITIAFDIYA